MSYNYLEEAAEDEDAATAIYNVWQRMKQEEYRNLIKDLYSGPWTAGQPATQVMENEHPNIIRGNN